MLFAQLRDPSGKGVSPEVFRLTYNRALQGQGSLTTNMLKIEGGCQIKIRALWKSINMMGRRLQEYEDSVKGLDKVVEEQGEVTLLRRKLVELNNDSLKMLWKLQGAGDR